MKFSPNLLLRYLIVVMGISFWTLPVYADSSVTIKLPPASLEKWYKPSNKRQVWLHTMFRLRREMQAISVYADQNNQQALQKWIKRLDKDYNKIADMVPEWENENKPRLLPELEMFAEKGDVYRLGKTLKMIKRTCDDCHTDYQPLVTATYRSPHYEDIKIKDRSGKLQSFEDNMEQLSESVNLTLIALDDGRNDVAMQASKSHAVQLDRLGDSCSSCHKDDAYPQERILGKATRQRLDKLQANIQQRQGKRQSEING